MKDSVDATVAQEKVSINRSDVKKEGTFKKFLALLANTVLTIKTVSREDIHTAQVDVPGNTDYPVNIVSPNPNRTSITLRNVGGNNAWIGDYTVTSTTGFLLRSFESITLDRTWGAIYAVSTSGAVIAYVEE
jgi:hypothetical protein